MTKLTYLIQVWGGCDSYLLKSLQIVQNKVARVVTRKSWSTPVKVLLSECGWLSVTQLATFHTVLLVFKVLQTGSPAALAGMFSTEYECATRQASQGFIKPSSKKKVAKSGLVASSFRYRALNQFNLLPAEIRNETCLIKFKHLTKKGILENLPVD